jgi:hypothetical protein
MAHTARQAGLLEPLALALLLQAGCSTGSKLTADMHAPVQAQAQAWAEEALALAQRQGFADVQRRAQAWLAAHANTRRVPPHV